MKKTIYLSGPISDNETNEPRKDWQKAFLGAGRRLEAMGFRVISPVDIAERTEEEWRGMWAAQPMDSGKALRMPEQPTRATYVMACLETMNTEALAGRLHGLFLLGRNNDPMAISRLRASHGVQMEIHMAEMLGLPVFAEFCGDCQVRRYLQPLKGGLRLCPGGEFGREGWSSRL